LFIYFLLYKCHNKKFVYSSGRPQLSTIWQKSKQMSYLDICFASMNRPLHAYRHSASRPYVEFYDRTSWIPSNDSTCQISCVPFYEWIWHCWRATPFFNLKHKKVFYFALKLQPSDNWRIPTHDVITVVTQGDQMGLWKNRPKCSPPHFLSKLTHYFHRAKRSPRIYATWVTSKKLPPKTIAQ
jgi:hypothetical protein